MHFDAENGTRLIDRLLFSLKNLIAMSYTRIKNWLQFLTDGIWRITEDEISPVRRQIYSCIKIVYLSVNQFLNDRIQIRASALTYSTLLSIIPILAILFAIARGFGFDALMEIQLRKGVASQQSELMGPALSDLSLLLSRRLRTFGLYGYVAASFCREGSSRIAGRIYSIIFLLKYIKHPVFQNNSILYFVFFVKLYF